MSDGLRLHVLSAMLLALASSSTSWAQDAQPQSVPPGTWGPDGVVIERNIMVPMRDGVRLATDVYLPAHDGQILPGKFPTLLVRTPYGKTPGPIVPGAEPPEVVVAAHEADYYASHGYAVVVQDCRGRFDSEGTFYPYTREGTDGYDTLEWAVRRPWSNGKVGTFAGSYLAAAQNALAVLRPPQLAAMFIEVGASNYFAEGAYRGGEFALLHNLVYSLSFGVDSHDAEANPAVRVAMLEDLEKPNLAGWLLAFPFAPGASPLTISPTINRWFQDMVDHSTFDSYWHQNGYDFEDRYKEIPDVPMYFQSGWYDLFEHGSLHNYAAMAKLHHSPTKLLLGPWTHGDYTPVAGDVDFGRSAHADFTRLEKAWFDRTLKGEDNGAFSVPNVRYFVMGGGSGLRNSAGKMEDGGEWETAATWPPREEKPTPFYLHANGLLSAAAPGREAPATFIYDPRHPVPTIGGQIASGADFTPPGPQDQKCKLGIPFCGNDLPLSSRKDVLVVETPPLKSDVVIAGPVTVELWISSSAADTDFSAKLIDQFPPNADYPWGYAMNLEDGIIRVSSVPDDRQVNLLKRGEIRAVKIDLLAVANRFVKGHRIRLDISSSNFPFFAVNPNTGERVGFGRHVVIAQNTVYHDAAHPSYISLPLMPVTSIKGH
jgi:putative CocE/NonD family hydrolase